MEWNKRYGDSGHILVWIVSKRECRQTQSVKEPKVNSLRSRRSIDVGWFCKYASPARTPASALCHTSQRRQRSPGCYDAFPVTTGVLSHRSHLVSCNAAHSKGTECFQFFKLFQANSWKRILPIQSSRRAQVVFFHLPDSDGSATFRPGVRRTVNLNNPILKINTFNLTSDERWLDAVTNA